MTLDTITMVVMIFITNLVMMVFVWIVGWSQALQGLVRFAVVLLVNALIYVVVYLNLQFGFPPPVYLVLSNTLFSIALAFQLFAVAAFRRERLPLHVLLLPVLLVLIVVLTQMEAVAVRKGLVNLILVAQEVLILRQLWRSSHLGSGRPLMIAVTAAVMADFLYRAVVALAGPPVQQVGAGDPLNAVTYLVMFMTVVLFSFGFMLAAFEQQRSRIQQQQKEQDLRLERERFSRELHDGLGGHLAALSTMLSDGIENRGMLAETVDQALLDMRMMMEGIGDESRDVGMTLGMLRHRLHARLKMLGIDTVWDMEQLPIGCTLPEGGSLHLMRIVQEALTNVARHSGADRVEVRAALSDTPPGRVRIEVVDNGRGLDPAGRPGNGIANMKHRAQVMGGEVHVASTAKTGTGLTLIVPVSLEA